MFRLGLHSTGNIMVGPPNVKDPKPLPPDLEEFVSNSGGHGFIIISFDQTWLQIFKSQW